MDLLKPEGQKHTGTGRSREYSADEIRRAAVLVELAKWRVPMTVLATSFDEFADDYEYEWNSAVNGSASVYLVMSWSNDLTVWNMTIGEPGLLLLDDSQFQPQVPTPQNELELPASAIVINLSRLLSHQSRLSLR